MKKNIIHHKQYKEISGKDEIVFLTYSEHKKINHRRLFPDTTKEELCKISGNAHRRTKKYSYKKKSRELKINKIKRKTRMMNKDKRESKLNPYMVNI